jgi:hypothetical protein
MLRLAALALLMPAHVSAQPGGNPFAGGNLYVWIFWRAPLACTQNSAPAKHKL